METLWIDQKPAEKVKRVGQILSGCLDNSLQNCEENKRANFTLKNLAGCAGLLQEREKGRPGVFRDLNRGNYLYHTCSRVANEMANDKSHSSANSEEKERDRESALLLNENDLWEFFLDLLTFFYGELDPE